MSRRLKSSSVISGSHRNLQWRFTQLEPRLMLAADAGVAVCQADTATTTTHAQATQVSSPEHLVIIDSGIDDASALMNSVPADAEVVLLDRNSCGIEQITDAIASHKGLKSIHLLSHGSEGKLQMGNQTLSAENLETYRSQIHLRLRCCQRQTRHLVFSSTC